MEKVTLRYNISWLQFPDAEVRAKILTPLSWLLLQSVSDYFKSQLQSTFCQKRIQLSESESQLKLDIGFETG